MYQYLSYVYTQILRMFYARFLPQFPEIYTLLNLTGQPYCLGRQRWTPPQ